MNRVLRLAAMLSLLLWAPARALAEGFAVVLLPGAAGPIPADFAMSIRPALEAAGIDTRLAGSAAEAVRLAGEARARGRKTILLGNSRGGLGVAQALAMGAQADGVVLVSTGLNWVRGLIGSPLNMPPVLVLHHRRDRCPNTNPAEVPGFIGWAQGKAQAAWFENDGAPVTNPCGPRDAHGFYLEHGPPVAAILTFLRGL